MFFVDTGDEKFVRIPLEENERIEIYCATISSGGKLKNFIMPETSKKISSIIDIRVGVIPETNRKENVK